LLGFVFFLLLMSVPVWNFLSFCFNSICSLVAHSSLISLFFFLSVFLNFSESTSLFLISNCLLFLLKSLVCFHQIELFSSLSLQILMWKFCLWARELEPHLSRVQQAVPPHRRRLRGLWSFPECTSSASRTIPPGNREAYTSRKGTSLKVSTSAGLLLCWVFVSNGVKLWFWNLLFYAWMVLHLQRRKC
jgi:hypothetical protein